MIKKFRHIMNQIGKEGVKDLTSIGTLFLVVGIFIFSIGIAGKEPVTQKAEARIDGLIKLENARPINNYKSYAFKINNKFITLSEQELYSIIYEYIEQNAPKSKRNPKYINKVTKCYMKLFDKCDNNDVVLRYIGLCKIESNFNCHSKSHCGAYGVPQVLLNTWKGVMKDKWNITIDQYKNDIYTQLYTGWKIYDIYLKKNKGNVSRAHSQYSGGAGGYHNKVLKQHHILKMQVIKASK